MELRGSTCGNVACSGTGALPPICFLRPTRLSFGTIPVHDSRDLSFTMTNTGGGVLSGTVTAPCLDFSVIGSASYNLAAGQYQIFTVRFAPTSEGAASCTLATGCGSTLDCSGTTIPPLCSITPSTLSFGTVAINETKELTFTMTNTGGATLSGTITEECPDFSLLGATSYDLAAGQYKIFTVRFAPTSEGAKSCTLATGCVNSLECTGTTLSLDCPITPTTLSFGEVAINQTRDLTFTMTNIGEGAARGTITESCPDFSLIGETSYDLATGQYQIFTVRFAPTTVGLQRCTVVTGCAASVECDGIGN
jgi:hypothetical protein